MRGQAARNGETRISQNGYHYTKHEGRWELTHRLMMERHLGRPLNETERVKFEDNDKTNLVLENLRVVIKGKASLRTQRARLVARRNELNAQIALIDKELEAQEVTA